MNCVANHPVKNLTGEETKQFKLFFGFRDSRLISESVARHIQQNLPNVLLLPVKNIEQPCCQTKMKTKHKKADNLV